MLLKRVEVHGFKSFADATNVTFEPSITAIVGPNGSGKSNIVDAIRWVLGEQSAKSLRGSKMEDVIFAGSDKRKAMNIAEVRLILDNSDGSLPIEYNEVSIGRRVSRSGGSDYLLNGTVCRLKDVEELIMDTGIGKEAYSIVGQGKIDSILSSKATDRRELFEEAAGIIKYKTKKEEASRRLEETELNLTRVLDIINELERQAEPLKKQAEDARKYKEYSSELKELEEGLLLTNWSIYARELGTYENDRNRLAASLEERENLVNSFEARVDQLQSELDQINEDIDQKQESYFEKKNLRENLDNQVQMLREKQNSLFSHQNRIQSESDERYNQIERYESEREEVQLSISNLNRYRQELVQSIETGKQEIENLLRLIKIDEGKIDLLKNDSMEYINQRSELKSQLQRYQDEEMKLNGRINELIQLRSNNDKHLDEAAHKLQQLEQELKEINDELIQLQKDEDILRHRQSEDQEELQKLQERFISLREDYQGSKSRLKLLRDMENSLEGYYQGVKNVLKAKDRLTGLVGVVAELLHVDEDKEKAIAAALGGGLQNIVVETGEDAKNAIEFLKKTRGGRATFLPLDMVRGNRMNDNPNISSIDGYLGIASDFVQVEPRLKPMIYNLLGRIIIARDMDAALQISRNGKQRLRIVTLDGDNINPGGSVSGGSSQQQSSNLLGRTREIEELSQKVESLKEELELIKDNGQLVKTRVEEQDKRLGAMQTRIHQLELKRVNLRKDVEQLQKDTQHQEGLLNDVDQEFESSHEELGRLDVLIQQVEYNLNALNTDFAEQEKRLKSLEKQLTEQRERIDQLQRENTEGRIQLASFDEQENSHNQRLEQLTQLKSENLAKIETLKLEWNELETAKGDLEGQIQQIIEEKRTIKVEEQQLGEEVVALKQKEKDLSGAFKKEEARARSIRRRVNELSKEVSQYEIKIAELSSRLESIKEQLKEDHGIDLDHFMREIEPIEDLDKVEKRIRSLKWRLRVLGAVNQGAEEEYATLIKRLSFLKEQHADLIKARESLDEMINELDETIKERFFVTFERVKVEFEEIFTKLFGGGSAQLGLSDPDNLLETGVEINAQPPGKKLQKLSLMSGGEKALTALGLIFAFLKVKPSPFYILDEIDAPLDEANVERFATFVREFSSMAQFIIVTHRNRTMAEADAMYGVTMEESGVSKLISYKFSEKAS